MSLLAATERKAADSSKKQQQGSRLGYNCYFKVSALASLFSSIDPCITVIFYPRCLDAKEPKAQETLARLNAQNRFALALRLHNMKTAAGRQKKIEAFVEMLKRGETIYPQSFESRAKKSKQKA